MTEVRRWAWGLESARDIETCTREVRALSDQVTSIVAQRSGRPLKEVQVLLKRCETWLSAQEALALGLVDEVA